MLHRVAAKSLEESVNERFKYFTEKIVPQFSGDNMDHTLIFVPNYLEYVKVGNIFIILTTFVLNILPSRLETGSRPLTLTSARSQNTGYS